MPNKRASKAVQAAVKVEATRHEDRRSNIPSAEHESVIEEGVKSPIRVAYERRNQDCDPQLIWRGKDVSDWSDLVVSAPVLYIQEKIHPKAIIDDLLRHSKQGSDEQLDLFADFNGLPKDARATEFYQHDANWTNRMILGDSLQVMASLAEREGLKGKVQCIYLDPPYGIKFNSNFQWSTTVRDVKDGQKEHITREPEQVKAFRDTWKDGIHSYLTYLRDRLTVARDLLTDSGSIFVQIGDENVHLVRALMDEVFGDENFISVITYRTSSGLGSTFLQTNGDFIVWFSKNKQFTKFRQLFSAKGYGEGTMFSGIEEDSGNRRRLTSVEASNQEELKGRPFRLADLVSSGLTPSCVFSTKIKGKDFSPRIGYSWKTNIVGMEKLVYSNRLEAPGKTLQFVRFYDDFPVQKITNFWTDTVGELTKNYVVQTSTRIIERCILMTTDPGDLVLDPTCGSGTTAYVAEQWGRRWITIDTSRVALALARARIMGARYPYYLLADSPEGQKKEAEIQRVLYESKPTHNDIRQGFVYERVPHITLKSIANNSEIDVIYDKWQPQVLGFLAQLNQTLRGHSKPFTVETGGREGKQVKFDAPDKATFTMPSGEVVKAYELVEWEVPRHAPEDWSQKAIAILEQFWKARIGRQQEIDASIAAKAEYEYLYDKPYEVKSTIRVAGPFTVESISPHRVLVVDADEELIDPQQNQSKEEVNFVTAIMTALKVAGVQQAHKEDRITFTSLEPFPGRYVSAEGRYIEAETGTERRAGIFISSEFTTVSRGDLVSLAREAGELGFDLAIACGFNFDAHSTEFDRLGRIPILKARMNNDLHMAGELKDTGKGNLFVVFGEPDIEIIEQDVGQVTVQIKGVDVFHPQSGEVKSSSSEEIACWFIDTDYNSESFFVRHAYFLGASSDPYKALKTSLRSEIDETSWASLKSSVSRPFTKPKSGRIAVKVINHLGDEVMKVYEVR